MTTGRGIARETLRHNPLNAVTAAVERVTGENGETFIRKELREPSDSVGPWAASSDPRHWNYWRRELEIYQDPELRAQLQGTGLVLPKAEVEEHPGHDLRDDEAAGQVADAGWTPNGEGGRRVPDGERLADAGLGAHGGWGPGGEGGGWGVLWMEDVEGRGGTEFELGDHAALARGCGRWQAGPGIVRPWTSAGFLREYSTTRVVPWELLDDDAAWQQPLVGENWPGGLRDAWGRLVAHREELLRIVEQSPRASCHLDLWVCNAIRRPDGEIALLDWAFTGDGAVGEDMGNHIPDAVFDLFWPAERLPELADTCITNYFDGLREGGWQGNPDDVRRAVMASTVKYAWLLPNLLGQASNPSHQAYHQQADSQHLFQQRGLALAFVADWCATALKA